MQRFVSVCGAAAIEIAVVSVRYALHFGGQSLAVFNLNYFMRHCFRGRLQAHSNPCTL